MVGAFPPVAMRVRYGTWYLSPLCLRVGFRNEFIDESRLTPTIPSDRGALLLFQLRFDESLMQ